MYPFKHSRLFHCIQFKHSNYSIVSNSNTLAYSIVSNSNTLAYSFVSNSNTLSFSIVSNSKTLAYSTVSTSNTLAYSDFNFQTFCVVSSRFNKNYVQRFSATRAMFIFQPWNIFRRFAIYLSTNQASSTSHSNTNDQCDQIWRNFATLVKSYQSLW